MSNYRRGIGCARLCKNGDLPYKNGDLLCKAVQEWRLVSIEWRLLCIAVQEWSLTVQCCARMEINKQGMEIGKQRMETAVHCCARLCPC